MAAVKLRPGARFDPEGFYAWCETQVSEGSMDRKWVPDFLRVVEDFESTPTQKVLVRPRKQAHVDRSRCAGNPVYWRERGDTAFRVLTDADYAALREEFAAAERLELLER